jgi:hypothetical protein
MLAKNFKNYPYPVKTVFPIGEVFSSLTLTQ